MRVWLNSKQFNSITFFLPKTEHGMTLFSDSPPLTTHCKGMRFKVDVAPDLQVMGVVIISCSSLLLLVQYTLSGSIDFLLQPVGHYTTRPRLCSIATAFGVWSSTDSDFKFIPQISASWHSPTIYTSFFLS